MEIKEKRNWIFSFILRQLRRQRKTHWIEMARTRTVLLKRKTLRKRAEKTAEKKLFTDRYASLSISLYWHRARFGCDLSSMSPTAAHAKTENAVNSIYRNLVNVWLFGFDVCSAEAENDALDGKLKIKSHSAPRRDWRSWRHSLWFEWIKCVCSFRRSRFMYYMYMVSLTSFA